MKNRKLPIAIIGAGPVGLATAAHLIERKLPFIILEACSSVGQNILSWGHVKVFSPWRYNMDKVALRLLEARGWLVPDMDGLPTGDEIVRDYLVPLADLLEIQPYIQLESKVLSIGRKGLDKMKTADRDERPFRINVVTGVLQYFQP